MRTPTSLRFEPLHALMLAAVALIGGGCPAQPDCPSCRFRSANFTVAPEDVTGLVSAQMHTEINHATGECPGRGGTEGCVTNITEDITCKVKTAGKKSQPLPVASGAGATHNVTIILQKAVPKTMPAAVGDPTTSSPPPSPICPKP